jgi:PEP-CTERM motif
MKKLLATLTFLLAPVIAQADLINGGFETGNFTGWSTAGDTIAIDASLLGIPPPAGNFQALITNAPSLSGPHAESYSGVSSIRTNPLEVFLGLPTHSLADLGKTLPLVFEGFPMEGSAIRQSFTASGGGDILSFRWNYLTRDCCASPSDFAFAVLDGNLFLLASAASPLVSSTAPFFPIETGYQFFATTLAPGAHYIGIGVVDTWDETVNSAVLVDNFFVTKIPEPASWWLFGLGLMGIAMGRIVISRRQHG